MSYRNKTYVALDYDTDKNYYNIMRAWIENDNIDFNFHNAHDLNNLLPTSSEETIKGKLRERLHNTKNFILLIGKNTKNLYKFVRWEIEHALALDLPIIAVNLNGIRKLDNTYCPPILKNQLAIHTDFSMKIIKYSLDIWPNSHIDHKSKNEISPYYWIDKVYSELEI